MTCGNTVKGGLGRRVAGWASAHKSAQKQFTNRGRPQVGRGGGRSCRHRRGDIGGCSGRDFGGDVPLSRRARHWGVMETLTDTTTPTPAAADTLLLTLDEAARHLRCARRSVERHVARSRLRVVHLGRSVRIERRELERFVATMRDARDG